MRKNVIIGIIIAIIGVILLAGIFFKEIIIDKDSEDRQLIGIESESLGLGHLCSGKEDCINFCHSSKGRCADYCDANPENQLCALIFPTLTLKSCGDKIELFSIPVISYEDILEIIPLGSLNPIPHVFPTDHMYIFSRKASEAISIKSKVFAPGDIKITEISMIEHGRAIANFTDYSIDFYPCKEVFGRLGHVSSLSDNLLGKFNFTNAECYPISTTGGETQKSCITKVNIEISAGEEIGSAGGPGQTKGLDFWLVDHRTKPIIYANPIRWGQSLEEKSFHVACPLDYYTADIRSQLYEKVKRTIEPRCGTVEQDVAGTAQGAWFAKGKAKNPEDPHLALSPDNLNPLKQVFSVGTSIPGLEGASYYFDPKSSGLVNLDFKKVKPDEIYCYDSLLKKFDAEASPMRILIQLTSESTLKIEKQDIAKCGQGPWQFGNNFAEFER